MKRIWFAAVFLVMAAALCLTEQLYISSFHTEMDKKITAAATAAEGKNKAELDARLKDVRAYWDGKNEILCMLSSHTLPDEIGAGIRAIYTDHPHIEEELARIRALNDVLYENQHITFANIF